MNTLGGTKRKGATVGFGILAMFPMLGWAPSAVAQEAFAGVCEMTTVSVSYSPGLKLTPSPLIPTTVIVDGSGTCTIPDGTTTATVGTTLFARGTTTVGTFSCAGGTVVGTGTFDVAVEGYPTGEPGRAVITVTETVATVTIEADNLSVTASGVFEQPLPTVATCTSMTGLTATTWEGTVAFAATGLMPPVNQDGQRRAQVSPSSSEQ